jgi:hypothetical protein
LTSLPTLMPEEGIRQGLEQAQQGKTRPAMEFFREFEAEHGRLL